LLYGLGMLELGMTFCYKQLLMDADMAAMVKLIVGGIPVNDDTMSIDLIREVGIGKNFLAHKNTFQNRKIQSQPILMDRAMRGRWEEKGSSSMPERARDKYREIIATHQVPELAPEIKSRLRQIVNEAEAEQGLPISVD